MSNFRLSRLVTAPLTALALVLPAAALGQGAATDAAGAAVELPPMQFPGWGFNTADIDPAISPGDDFDAYVNGKWKAATPIPEKYPDYGVSRNLAIAAEKAVR